MACSGKGTDDCFGNWVEFLEKLPGVVSQDSNVIEQTYEKLARKILTEPENCISKFRRIFWPAFLGIVDRGSTLSQQAVQMSTVREEYSLILQRHREIGVGDLRSMNPQVCHPLAVDANFNPWRMQHQSEELTSLIAKDVDRTFPEKSLFQLPNVRKSLHNILYAWSKEHPEMSYKQGMNELVGVVYLAVFRDQDVADFKAHSSSPLPSANEESKSVEGMRVAADYNLVFSETEKDIEADTFSIFSKLMAMGLSDFYETVNPNYAAPGSNSSYAPSTPFDPKKAIDVDAVFRKETKAAQSNFAAVNPLMSLSGQIFGRLHEVDPDLANHLSAVKTDPQIFFMRWIRLLFCREFLVDQTLVIWDALFAFLFLRSCQGDSEKLRPPQKGISTFIKNFAVSMLTFLRPKLLSVSGMECLRLCLNYPEASSPFPFVKLTVDLLLKRQVNTNAAAAAAQGNWSVWSATDECQPATHATQEVTSPSLTKTPPPSKEIAARRHRDNCHGERDDSSIHRRSLSRDSDISNKGVIEDYRAGGSNRSKPQFQDAEHLRGSTTCASSGTTVGFSFQMSSSDKQRNARGAADGKWQDNSGRVGDNESCGRGEAEVPQLLDLSKHENVSLRQNLHAGNEARVRYSTNDKSREEGKLGIVIDRLQHWIVRCKDRSARIGESSQNRFEGGPMGIGGLSGFRGRLVTDATATVTQGKSCSKGESEFLEVLCSSLEGAVRALEDVRIELQDFNESALLRGEAKDVMIEDNSFVEPKRPLTGSRQGCVQSPETRGSDGRDCLAFEDLDVPVIEL